MKIGASLGAAVLLFAVAFPARAAEKEKSASVIAGTVFREPGFAVPGAEIELTELNVSGKKARPRKAVSDSRGEFAFRLPSGDAKFRIRVAAKGLQPQEKEVATTPGVRTDVYFTLQPAAN